MSEKIHVLAQQLFGKPTVAACDLQEIRDLVQRHPYFAPAQFLLLQKLQEENHPDYGAQLQKAVLYYHNPLAFEYFINAGRFYTDISFDEAEPEAETELPVITTKEEDGSVDVSESEVDHQEVERSAAESVLVENEALPMQEVVVEETTTELPLQENEALPLEPEVNDNMAQVEEPAVPVAESDVRPEETMTQPSSYQLPKPPVSDLAFEPFHTVDYFASQGIRLSQEEISRDKFGKQLKSFTEWLKTMKRLPAQTAPLDAVTEEKLEHLAEDSVHNPEVVTETMAEVWLKQGNTQKAIETYNKLSLQNPSKSAYFAALIENLKRS